MKRITTAQADLARDRWKLLTNTKVVDEQARLFTKFLGCPEGEKYYSQHDRWRGRYFEVPDVAADRILALCGPHWRAIYKIIEVTS